MATKPILFNTEMAQAIIEGRKTQTRRVCKGQGDCNPVQCGYHPPYKPGDILWVRESWRPAKGIMHTYINGEVVESGDCHDGFEYRAGGYYFPDGFKESGDDFHLSEIRSGGSWHPSIHMPKEAARIFLRVKDVRVERLQDIHEKYKLGPGNPVIQEGFNYLCDFIATWENTIKPADREWYGWDANPWVWVIEFEHCEKPEGWCE